MDELSKYRDAAVELSKRNAAIDALADRLAVLEDIVVKRSGATQEEFRVHTEAKGTMKA